MTFPAYPEYKDSGVEWLGKVPSHWRIDRLKASISSCRNGIWGEEAKGDENDVACIRVADFDRQKFEVKLDEPTIRNVGEKERSTRTLNKGDLLLEKSGGGEKQPVGCVVLYTDASPAICSNFIAKIELATDMDSSFWRYVHAAAYSIRLNVGSINQTSGIQNLDQDRYFNERAVYPPLIEQHSISKFLDHETKKIDELIHEQEQLIELLKEKRQSIISNAVCRGLDPNVPMKDSGVEWLGMVPEHWKVIRLRRLIASIEQGWSPECFSRVADEDEWGVLKAGCLNGGTYNDAENKALPPELHPESAYEVLAGNVLMSRASGSPELVGSTALVESTRSKLMISDKIFRLHLNEDVNANFFVISMGSRVLRVQIETALSGGNGMASNLPQSSLFTFQMCTPPKNEQEEIASFLKIETGKLDALILESKKEIALLLERRSALISAAVTGQIDVRNFQPRS